MAKTPKVSNIKSGAKKPAKLDPADNGKGFKKVSKKGTEGGSKATKWTPPWAKGKK